MTLRAKGVRYHPEVIMVVNEFVKQSDYPQRVYRKNTATGGKRNLIDKETEKYEKNNSNN